MKDLYLEKHLSEFLQVHLPESMPFLIAVSGGVDSTALLHGLAAVSKKGSPHVVHIDHGWREKSQDEARELERKVALLDLPFHSFRLPPAPLNKNLEEWSRRARMNCFSDLGRALGTKIVFLAHHADDQIEVVLKRVLEGSSIKNFRGMRRIEEREGLTLMRPLLAFRKSELLKFVKKRNISFFDDPTNRDPKFLRARFRTVLLPSLRDAFGKEFEESILRVSEEALLLDEWVQESLTQSFSFGEGEGISYAASKHSFSSPFLIHQLIDHLRKKWALPAPSRWQIQEATKHFLDERSGSKTFPLGEGVIMVEHNWIAVLERKLLPLEEVFFDQEKGSKNLSCWEISWREAVFDAPLHPTWNDLFQGKVAHIYIPKQPFTISRSSDRLLKNVKGKIKFPTSFRPFLPAIIQQDRLVADFLTGYLLAFQTGAPCYEVRVRLKSFK